ncbi:MAG: LytTR family transcriptional regulator DNA-binding domain-containing protein [Bacillota bacterium]|nr:LytTR family transcriptional regulator DNA-binding domain-containing protein [Bacillota bacterium]
MQETRYITILSNGTKLVLNADTILYVLMIEKTVEIHVSGGKVYETRMRISELEEGLGDGFIKVHRGCLVSAMAIHDITDRINLNNGESLIYTLRKKNQIIAQFQEAQKRLVSGFTRDGIPATEEEYRAHYRSFDAVPFAFADIEMVFDEARRAVDWIFRYGNPALAKLEKLPLEKLVGSSFGSLFSNMDAKWLRLYERATLYGETLEVMDYSPEIDAYLKVTCFPTFKGHCGCILFDLTEIEYAKISPDADKALMRYFGKTRERDSEA